MRQALLYLPGLDGTGRLLHRQPALYEKYQVQCVAYPQKQSARYSDLAELAAGHLAGAEQRPAVVLAESFGGAVALTLALRRPELVERLVLVNTFAYFPRRFVITLASWLGRFLPAQPSNPATRGVRGRFFFAPAIPQSERDAWWDRTTDVPMSAFGQRLALIAGLDLRDRLAAIDIPALVVVAPDDRVVPPKAGRDLARRLPRARLLEIRVGHAALIHPRINVARLLDERRYWDWVSAPVT